MGSKVTMKSEGVYITLEEQERIMEELLRESSVYAADRADETVADSVHEGGKYQGAKDGISLDGFEVTNNTGDEYVDEEYVPDPVEDPDYGTDPCDGCEDHVDGTCISNGACADAGKERDTGTVTPLPVITHGIQFFMPMRRVPTSTAQEKGYRVIPNGYSHEGGVKKPRFRVVTFDKPGTAEAKAELTAALNTALKKIERQWKAEGVNAEKGSGKNGTGSQYYWKGKETEGTVHDYANMGTAGMITQQRKDGHGLRTPLFGRGVPLSLTVKWCFGGTAVESGKVKDGTPRTTKPDTDNLDKMLKDCMTALGFWWDDAQVAEEHIGKYWSRIPGVFVRIEVIRNE